MQTFKFLQGFQGHPPLSEHLASWMWDYDGTLYSENYDLITGRFNGIADFLYNFPENYIVIVHSIVGVESGIVHSREDMEGLGWGFDIRSAQLDITYYQFLH